MKGFSPSAAVFSGPVEPWHQRVPPDGAADVIWATNSAEFCRLLVQDRGWSPQRFESWLADSWCRLPLTEPKP